MMKAELMAEANQPMRENQMSSNWIRVNGLDGSGNKTHQSTTLWAL